MDLKDLLKGLAEFDEMESNDGMNIVESADKELEVIKKLEELKELVGASDDYSDKVKDRIRQEIEVLKELIK